MYYLNHWIPAFAGMTAGWLLAFAAMMKGRLLAFTQMTKGASVRHLSVMAKGLSGWQPACSLFVVIPAKAGIQEGAGGMLDEFQRFPARA